MFRQAYLRTSLLDLGWIPADFRSTVVVAHRTTYNMWTSLSLLDIKPRRRGSSCCLMGSPDININSGFKTASRGEPRAAQCGGTAPCQASLVFSCCRLCFSSHSSRVSWWMHRTSDLTQCGLDNFAFYVLYQPCPCPTAHCSYLDIYISQNIRLCKGDFEGQFQTSLQTRIMISFIWKFISIILIFLLFPKRTSEKA